MILHDDSDWGTALEGIYKEELHNNTEEELWSKQKPTYIETPVDTEEDEDIEDSEWGKELARIYKEVL